MPERKVKSERAITVSIIVEDLMKFADDSIMECETDASSFNLGKNMGYYEVLNIIKDSLIILELEPKDVGLNFDIDRYFFSTQKE